MMGTWFDMPLWIALRSVELWTPWCPVWLGEVAASLLTPTQTHANSHRYSWQYNNCLWRFFYIHTNIYNMLFLHYMLLLLSMTLFTLQCCVLFWLLCCFVWLSAVYHLTANHQSLNGHSDWRNWPPRAALVCSLLNPEGRRVTNKPHQWHELVKKLEKVPPTRSWRTGQPQWTNCLY